MGIWAARLLMNDQANVWIVGYCRNTDANLVHAQSGEWQQWRIMKQANGSLGSDSSTARRLHLRHGSRPAGAKSISRGHTTAMGDHYEVWTQQYPFSVCYNAIILHLSQHQSSWPRLSSDAIT